MLAFEKHPHAASGAACALSSCTHCRPARPHIARRLQEQAAALGESAGKAAGAAVAHLEEGGQGESAKDLGANG